MTQCTHQSQNVSATRLIASDYTLSRPNALIISGKMKGKQLSDHILM